MFRRFDNSGCRSPFYSGNNFWIVVNATPPDSTASFVRTSARLQAGTGGCG